MTFLEAMGVMDQSGRVARTAWGHARPNWLASQRVDVDGNATLIGFYGPNNDAGDVGPREVSDDDKAATDWYELP